MGSTQFVEIRAAVVALTQRLRQKLQEAAAVGVEGRVPPAKPAVVENRAAGAERTAAARGRPGSITTATVKTGEARAKLEVAAAGEAGPEKALPDGPVATKDAGRRMAAAQVPLAVVGRRPDPSLLPVTVEVIAEEGIAKSRPDLGFVVVAMEPVQGMGAGPSRRLTGIVEPAKIVAGARGPGMTPNKKKGVPVAGQAPDVVIPTLTAEPEKVALTAEKREVPEILVLQGPIAVIVAA